MRRRDFIKGIGGTAGAWPFAARVQQPERMRQISVLMGLSKNDPVFQSSMNTFVQGLAQAGWIEGRNVHMDVRWARGDIHRMQTLAKEIVKTQPTVILSSTTPVTAALQRETRTIPIVFVIVTDPVGSGFVAGLPHPGGNITGFSKLFVSPSLI
jgi:putative ABC transport system substrate-binding protein